MPRYARTQSKTQIYHIILRGNERKSIFLDDEEKNRFINTLFEKKKDDSFILYAYCIMDNHVHLVIKENKDSLARIIKRVATSYAYYYNKKHKRVGHVFQDRYRSETIEQESYLLAAIRYIHSNPVKAGISAAEKYKWSSMSLYLEGTKGKVSIPEITEILSFFSSDVNKAIKKFLEFHRQSNNEAFIEMEETEVKEITEDNAIEYINNILSKSGISFEDVNKRQNNIVRNELIKGLSDYSTLSSRKIADITGINRETVRKVKLSKEPSLMTQLKF